MAFGVEQLKQPQEPEQQIEARVDLDPRLRESLGMGFEIDESRRTELAIKFEKGVLTDLEKDERAFFLEQ